MSSRGIECLLACPRYEESLGRFFQRLLDAGSDRFFYPHPLTADEAARICAYSGNDCYYLLIENEDVIGYGILRGWDEGYEIPSLGIAIDPRLQGGGLGRFLMGFLHLAASRRGAERVRLKVFENNLQAVALYRSIGYQFETDRRGISVGFLTLNNQHISKSNQKTFGQGLQD
jgi:[ribosomal protein S18]-alanine N-acetyltransferase